jgi:HlyD family secretion protein
MQEVLPPPNSSAYVPELQDARDAGQAAPRANVRGPVVAGLCIIVLLVVGFGGWAATAPLAGGAVAPGVISPDGSRKTIQHLEGGIIGTIMVRDGDTVAASAPLLTLEDTQARAVYEIILSQYRSVLAVQARLASEQLGRSSVEIPPELLAASDDPAIKEIIEVQRQLFATRRDAHLSRGRVLEQRILQLRDQARGFKAQVDSSKQRLLIVTEELRAKEILFEKRLIAKPAVLALRRAQAEIEGDRGEYQAAIAQAQQQIGETELELVALDAVRANEIAAELDRVHAELARLKQQVNASEDTLRRTVITAPVAGKVMDLRFKTRGGVIQPGEPILDIVPLNDDLLIDARVSPVDIDVVHPGLPAQVHLLAYAQRNLPQIEGKVLSVSADSLRDEQTGVSYYLVRVEVDRQQLARVAADVQLVPGMPAEVLIVTGERTLLGYLVQPFRDMFRRSLREV